MKFVMMEDPTLLKHAQTIFGSDLVKRAFIVQLRSKEDSSIIQSLNNRLYADKHQFDLDYRAMIHLEFINGRIVEFEVSEWGDIALVTDFDAYSIVNGDQIVPFVQS